MRLWNPIQRKDTSLRTVPRQTPNAAVSEIPQCLCSGVGIFPIWWCILLILAFSLLLLNKLLHYSPLTWGFIYLWIPTSKLSGHDLTCASQWHTNWHHEWDSRTTCSFSLSLKWSMWFVKSLAGKTCCSPRSHKNGLQEQVPVKTEDAKWRLGNLPRWLNASRECQ